MVCDPYFSLSTLSICLSLLDLGDPDIVALGGMRMNGVWNWTRFPFIPAQVGWVLPPPPENGDCIGMKRDMPLKAITFPCSDANRIMCN
jgi:hypothetical protein